MGLADQLALLRAGDAGHREGRRRPVESPDEAPRFRARVGRDPGRRRDPVAGRNVDAGPRAVEPPVVVGAADLAVHHLAHREVGPQVRAVRALDHRPARRVSVDHDPCAQEVLADRTVGGHLAREGHREPGLVIAARRLGPPRLQYLGRHAHDLPPRPVLGPAPGPVLDELTLYIYNVNKSSSSSRTEDRA